MISVKLKKSHSPGRKLPGRVARPVGEPWFRRNRTKMDSRGEEEKVKKITRDIFVELILKVVLEAEADAMKDSSMGNG